MATKHAVILSGGGAKGAYEIGVLKALLPGYAPMVNDGREMDPVVFAGTSVGSYNAAYLVSRSDLSPLAALAELEAIWRNRIASGPTRPNGVFRFRANPLDAMDVERVLADPLAPLRDILQDGAFFTKAAIERVELFFKSKQRLANRMIGLADFSVFVSTDKLADLIRQTLDLEKIRANKQRGLLIAATNWEKGAVKLFGNLEASGELEGLDELNDKIGHLAVLASTAIPGVFPPVEIYHTKYVDGGLLLNTPLGPALRGLRAMAPGESEYVLHVIYLDPDLKDVPLDQANGTMETLNRFSALSFASQVNRDVKKARQINQALELLRLNGGTGRRAGPALARVEESVRALVKDRHRPLTIHRYHPRGTLGGIFGLLAFESDYVGHLIEQGFQDAVTHDCYGSGCIFPRLKDARAAEEASLAMRRRMSAR